MIVFPSIRLSAASGVPFYRQIVDQITDFIRSGQLPSDTRLPSVRELAGELLVSLITIRRSYADLEQAGLIVRRQGLGTFVAKEVEMASREKILAEARAVLAGAVNRVLGLGLSPHQIREMLRELTGKEEDGNDGN
ncbi:GntR family transcriptional regulator [bacterium]|nr:GntR family transcriptional regulator [candidate division CSSED10-310 bacterium]